MEFVRFSVQALIEDPGIGGQGLNGTDLIGVRRDFTDLTESLECLSSLKLNPMTSILQFIAFDAAEGDNSTILYTHGLDGIDAPEGHDNLKSQIADAVTKTELPTGYRVAYTDRHDGVVERRCQFFDTEAAVREFAAEYYSLDNSYYGINHGFCRPESLTVAAGPRAWDMQMSLSDHPWEVSFPEDCYLDAFEITDPHHGQFEYGNIRRTHCVAVESNDDGTISIPLSAF